MKREFKGANEIMTTEDKAVLVYSLLSSVSRIQDEKYVPEGQSKREAKLSKYDSFYNSVGLLNYNGDKKTLTVSNPKATNQSSVVISLNDNTLSNDFLYACAQTFPIMKVDSTKSPYENLANIFTNEVNYVQAEQDRFEEARKDVPLLDKLAYRALKGVEPYGREIPSISAGVKNAILPVDLVNDGVYGELDEFTGTAYGICEDVANNMSAEEILEDLSQFEKENSAEMGE